MSKTIPTEEVKVLPLSNYTRAAAGLAKLNDSYDGDTSPQALKYEEIVEESKSDEELDSAKIPEIEAVKGIVLYTDGGCRPNPGPGGWGIHGYLYLETAPKKGSGNSEHMLTADGYVNKIQHALMGNTQKPKEVTPVHYIDGFGSFLEPVTNNIAEVVAAVEAIIHAREFNAQRVLIWTDSEYLRKGLESWVDSWQKNGWVKRDQSPIANVEYWKRLVEERDRLRQRGVEVEIRWIKAHDDFVGNEKADQLASMGVMTSQRGEARHSMDISPAEGYWRYDPERHPFLNHRRLYMNTLSASNKPGEYYIGEHGKDDDLPGKRISDGAFALVRLGTPDPVVEAVRQYQCSIAREVDSILLVRLDNVFRPDTHKQIASYGPTALCQTTPYRLDLESMDKQPISKERNPPMLVMRVVEEIEKLNEKLELFLKQDASVCVTDLTAILYETTVKVDKKGTSTTLMKLKPEYNVGFARLEVEANYLSEKNEVASASVTLTLGIDMLDRNSLKRLEDMLPKVSLISWNEAPNVFRYATVVQAGNDVGIWAGVYSNLRIVV